MATIDQFIDTAVTAGCPKNQTENFLRAGVVLQPKQVNASALARAMDQPGQPLELGYGGARGGGKTHWLLAQMATDDCQRHPGLKCLLLRKVGKAAREAFDDFRPKILARVDHDYTVQGGLRFPNGSRIILGHFKDEKDVDAYLGLEYDVIGVEEATTLSWRKYQAIQAANRTSKPDWRPRMYTTANPGGVGHAWYKNRFVMPARNKEQGQTCFIPATVDDNSFVNVEYKTRLNQLSGWMLRAWRYGDWDIAAGQFFTTFRHDVHVIAPFAIPDHWRVWCAMDYGHIHPTVVHLLASDEEGIIYHVDEHAASRWQIGQHAEAIKAMLGRWGIGLDRLYTFVAGADVFARRDTGPTIAQKYKGYGIRLRAANMDRVNGWAEMLDRLGNVERNIPPRWYIFETCPRLIETLPMLEHNPNRPEDVLKADIDDDGIGGDDAGDAARYGIMSAQRKQMTTSQIDWYATPQPTNGATKTARSEAEIEQMLDYG